MVHRCEGGDRALSQPIDNNALYLWSPAAHSLGDVTLVRVEDRYHLFSEVVPRELPQSTLAGESVILHAVSDDLLHWEELPPAIGCGPPGSFDAFRLYHLDVLVHEGMWYMFYTGLDVHGPGQRQSIGLAISSDGISWQKHPDNPVLEADPRWYEQAIPPEAAYQEKDRDRLWFRDPCVIRLPESGDWGMIVVARDKAQHPDRRGCIAWATSPDLLHWTPQPPIYSPGRFHTIETPSLFQHGSRSYIVFMSHRYWGGPVLVSDPYQDNGDYYAISTDGLEGPYRAPPDEVLLAAHRELRMGASRILADRDGRYWFYGWLRLTATSDDQPRELGATTVMPPVRPVDFGPEGQLHILYNAAIERWLGCAEAGLGDWHGKALRQRRLELGSQPFAAVMVQVRVTLLQGERAGLALRCNEIGSEGWYVVADRRYGRLEFGLLQEPGLIDARQVPIPERFTLRIIACHASVELYLDDRLLMHQARHREHAGRLAWLVERAEAKFELLACHRITIPTAR